MSEQTQATPRPWALCANGTEIIGGHAELTNETRVIADTNFWARPATEQERADAALIVHAVNAFDRLLAAAQAAVALIEDWGETVAGAGAEVHAQLQAAIESATKEVP